MSITTTSAKSEVEVTGHASLRLQLGPYAFVLTLNVEPLHAYWYLRDDGGSEELGGEKPTFREAYKEALETARGWVEEREHA